jgi:RNA polymerase sigma-70 factor (ECF subfamily)
MTDRELFRDLIRRVRAGDAEASAELVRRFEPAIRVAVHVRLTDPALRRLLDSTDICQSVMAQFFLRAASGEFQLDTPEQLLKLLTTMAHHKLINHALKQRAVRRDYRRVCPDGLDEGKMIDPTPDPSQLAAHHELLQELRRRLSAEERQLADRRASGRSWQEIAAEMGERPNTLRMRLDRAVTRVTRELGLDL